MPRPAQPFRARGSATRRNRALVPTLIVLAVLAVLYGVATALWTERMWFDSVDFVSVFSTKLLTETGLFLVFALVMAASVSVNAVLAYRLRPRYRPMSVEQQSLDRYRDAIDPVRRWVVIGASILLGLMAGAERRRSVARRSCCGATGATSAPIDAQFARTLGSSPSTYPWWRFVLGFAFAVVVLGLIAAAVTHYLYGGLRLQQPGERVTPAARVHLSVLLGRVRPAQGGRATGWTGTACCVERRRRWLTGADRTPTSTRCCPAKTILSIIALICAVLFFANIVPAHLDCCPASASACWCCRRCWSAASTRAWSSSSRCRPNEPDRERRTSSATSRRPARPTASTSVDDRGRTRHHGRSTRVSSLRTPTPCPASGCSTPTSSRRRSSNSSRSRGFYVFPDAARRRPVHDRRRDPDVVVAVRELDLNGIPDEPAELDQRAHRLHARLRLRRGARQRAATPTARRRWSRARTSRRPGDAGRLRAARSTSARSRPTYSHRRGARRRHPGRARHSRRRGAGGRSATPPTTARAASRSARRSASCCSRSKFQEANILLSGRVNGESKILYDREPEGAGARRSRRGSRSTATRTRPSSTAGSCGSSTATPRATRYPYSQRQSLWRRPPPTRARAASGRRGATAGAGQLHPQLGQGDGRRLRRHGDAVRVGRGRPGARHVDEGLPGHRSSRAARSRTN